MELDFSKLGGLLPAVIQDAATGRVLMVGFMNEESYRKTLETGCAVFFSRSRNKLWLKGETSGHRLMVKEISTDCDRDALLVKVEALGPGVCHEGYESCFFRKFEDGEWVIREPRTFEPSTVYGETAPSGRGLAGPPENAPDGTGRDLSQAKACATISPDPTARNVGADTE